MEVMMAKVERMRPGHLAGVMAAQEEAYHAITPEPLEVMEGKFRLCPETCFVFAPGGVVRGYIISYPWIFGDAPPLSSPAKGVPTGADSWYVHDLALTEAAKGLGVARSLYEAAMREAVAAGLRRSYLVAIQSSCGFWGKMGYEELAGGAGLGSYGAGAVMMARVLPGRAGQQIASKGKRFQGPGVADDARRR